MQIEEIHTSSVTVWKVFLPPPLMKRHCIRACRMLSIKWDTYNIPLPRLRDIPRRGHGKIMQESKVVGDLKETVFWIQQGSCTYKLTAVLAAHIKPEQERQWKLAKGHSRSQPQVIPVSLGGLTRVVLMSEAQVTTKGYADIHGLCSSLKPSCYLWAMLPMGTILFILMGVEWSTTWGHDDVQVCSATRNYASVCFPTAAEFCVDIRGLCSHRKPCIYLGSVLQPKAMLISVGYAISWGGVGWYRSRPVCIAIWGHVVV